MYTNGKCVDVEPRKAVVFGGDGFLGSHLVDTLLEQGHEVTVFDRFRGGRAKNLDHGQGRYRQVAGDFADQKAVAAALEGQEIAVHLISKSTPLTSWAEPLSVIEGDLRLSLNFFELCARLGVRKIVFASSGGTLYGLKSTLLDESMLPTPFNPYGIGKLCIEHFLTYFQEKFGIASDCYRIGNLYGPRQPMGRTLGVVATWIGRILSGQPLDVFGDEKTTRDYVYVKDAALLMTHSLRHLEHTDIYNLGTGRGTTILELLEVFKTLLAQPFEYRIRPQRAMDNTCSILLSDKLLRHFPGFEFLDLRSGIRETFDWAKAHPPVPGPLEGSCS